MKKHLIVILALTMMFSMPCYAEDVIVIGAGMAGLGAGKELMDDGRFNVTVLEAGGHVGGRIKTLKVNEGQPDEYTYEL
ncbi:MAG: FAD-dependent oxidoreductase, partial [bacterium]|nr:FAD-dependent oxidoreductase [bacterium]